MTKCHAPPCSGSTFCLTFCSLSSQPRDGQFEPMEWECWLIHKCVFNKALAQNLLEFYLSSSLWHLRSLSCLRYCKAKWNVKQFQPKWPSPLESHFCESCCLDSAKKLLIEAYCVWRCHGHGQCQGRNKCHNTLKTWNSKDEAPNIQSTEHNSHRSGSNGMACGGELATSTGHRHHWHREQHGHARN